MRSLVVLAALTVALSGCGATAAAPAVSSALTTAVSTTPSAASTTTLVETTSTTAAATTSTTTTVPYRELMITGTGKVYTLEESQAFGEFGPLLWNLVTTLNGTHRIEHGPRHEWVIWGPMWGGRIDDGITWRDTYGVTDIDAVDPATVAAAVPASDVIFLREVRWSLDQLNDYAERMREIALEFDSGMCGIDSRLRPGDGLLVRATPAQVFAVVREWISLGLPLEALTFESVGQWCLVSWYQPTTDPPTTPPAPGALGPQ